jgi:hypothetical protein
MRFSCPALGAAGWSLLASASLAQTPPAPAPQPPAPAPGATTEANTIREILDDPAANISLYDFNYGEPGSPVLPLIGVQADQISRVESVRRFGLSVLTGIGTSESSPAIGIDFSPFWLLARGPISLQGYRSLDPLARIFARTKVAAAASRGNEASAMPSSLVFSVSSKLLASQDPLMPGPFENCLRTDPGTLQRLIDRAQAAGSLAQRGILNGDVAEATERRVTGETLVLLRGEISAAYQVCANRVATEMSRRSSLDVGAGFRLTGAPGHFRELQGSGAIVWGTYATGVLGGNPQGTDPLANMLGMQARGVVHARYTIAEDVYNAAGVRTGQADSALLVAGIESVPVQGRSETLRWSLQAGWTRQDAPDATTEDRNYWRFLGIARLRLGEGMWLNGTFGRVQGRGVESDNYVSVGISIAPAAGSSGIDDFYRRAR